MATNLTRIKAIVARLPEVERVDVEAWGGEPTFRVRNKTFIFCHPEFTGLSVKLSPAEAAAVVATDPTIRPAGYGMGRHGWVYISIGTTPDDGRWQQLEEWIRMSYCLIAPKRLARQVTPNA